MTHALTCRCGTLSEALHLQYTIRLLSIINHHTSNHRNKIIHHMIKSITPPTRIPPRLIPKLIPRIIIIEISLSINLLRPMLTNNLRNHTTHQRIRIHHYHTPNQPLGGTASKAGGRSPLPLGGTSLKGEGVAAGTGGAGGLTSETDSTGSLTITPLDTGARCTGG